MLLKRRGLLPTNSMPADTDMALLPTALAPVSLMTFFGTKVISWRSQAQSNRRSA
jgi:hypothetical protein